MAQLAKVSLAFQLREDAALVRRKKVLTFQSTDTLNRVFETISGCSGGQPLWPKDFGERINDDEHVAAQFFFNASGQEAPEWQAAPPGSVLGDVAREMNKDTCTADLLIRLVERPGGSEDGEDVQGGMYYSRTFLHFKDDDDESNKQLTPRAHSDPVSSRMSSKAPSMSGLEESVEQERQRCSAIEDYIQKKLMPHLKDRGSDSHSRHGGQSDQQSSLNIPVLQSPLRIGSLEMGLACGTLTPSRGAEDGEEPAYLPPGPPVPAATTLPAPATNPLHLDAMQSNVNNQVDWAPTFPPGMPLNPPGEIWNVGAPNGGLVPHCHPQQPGWPNMIQQGLRPMHFGMLPGAAALQSPLQGSASDYQSGDYQEDDGLDDDDDDEGRMMGAPGQMMSPATSQADQLFDIVSRNDTATLRSLLSTNVDINQCTARGSHVLFRAVIKARDLEIVHLLLSEGADPRCRDDKGNQVMHFWARATVGRNLLLDMGRSLLFAGADINAQRFNDGMSPLHHVVVGHNNRRGWLDFHKALMLVRHGANIRLRTHVGQLPLSLVSVDGRAATKKLMQLLRNGIPKGAMDWPQCDHAGCVWCA